MIDLSRPSAENLAVTALSVGDTPPTVGQTANVEAELRAFGREPRQRQAVEFWVDGRREAVQYVDIPPGGTAAVKFACRLDQSGQHALEVRAEGDALEVDNRRYLALTVRQSLRVLCVDGRPSGAAFHGAADYLAAALASRGGSAEKSPAAVELAAENALLERDLGGYDCLFLCNVAQFTTSEVQALDAYLGRGGSVVFFLGDQVSPPRYNQQLGGGSAAGPILPAQIDAPVARPPRGIDPLGYRHPIVRAFRGHENSGLLTMPVEKYFRLDLSGNPSTKVVLRLANGDPLMVEGPLRRGHVLLVATSADVSWTAMPLWPNYVPLVREILAWCVAGQAQQRNLQVGEPLAGFAATPAGDATVTIQRPDGQTRSAELHADGDTSTWTYDETLRSGIYTARLGSPPGRGQLFAVNVNTAESDLSPLAVEDLRSEVWPEVPLVYQTTWQATETRGAGAPRPSGPWSIGLLHASVALLLAEGLLAWRLGHPRP